MTTRVVHVNDHVPDAVYIGRAMPGRKGSPFANPHKISDRVTRADAILLYEQHLTTHPELWALLPELRDKPLACWCRHEGEEQAPDNRCHGDVLALLIDHLSDDELRALAGAP